jgi:tape measure domain-containing protein
LAGSAGSIYVDLLLRDGRYRQGLRQSKDLTKTWERGVQSSTQNARGAFSGVIDPVENINASLSRLGVTVASVFSVTSLVNYSDTWKQMEGRLGLVVEGQEELREVQGQLFEIAKRTRQPLESITNLYSRMGQIIPDNLKGNLDLLGVTEAVATSLAITGETSLSAQAAIIQFTQALATDFEAAGQEIRSIQEQSPRLALALARALGTGSESLRKLVDDGKVSVESIGRAFREGQPEFELLRKELEKIPPTVAQSFTLLNNAFLQYVGLSDSAAAGTNAIALAVRTLADNLSTVITGLGTVSILIAGAFTARFLNESITSVGNFVKTLKTIEPTIVNAVTTSSAQLDVINGKFNLLKANLTSLGSANAVQSAVSFSTLNDGLLTTSKRLSNVEKESVAVRNSINRISSTGLINLNTVTKTTSQSFNSLNRVVSGFTTVSSTAKINGDLLTGSMNQTALVAAKQVREFNLISGSLGVKTKALGAATIAYNTFTKSVGLATVAGNLFLRAGVGLVAFLGGPLGVALSGFTIATIALAQYQTEGEKIASKYAETFSRVSDETINASDATEEFSNRLSSLRIAELAGEMSDLENSIKKITKELNDSSIAAGRWYDRLWNIFANPIDTFMLDVQVMKLKQEFADTKDLEAYKKGLAQIALEFPNLSELIEEEIKNVNALNTALIELPYVNLQIEASKKGVSLPDFSRVSRTNLNEPEGKKTNDEEAKEAARRLKQRQDELNSTFKRYEDIITGVSKEELSRRDVIAQLTSLLGTEYIPNQEALNEAIARYDESLKEASKTTSQWDEFSKNAAKSIQSAFADFLFDPFEDGVAGMAEGFARAIQRMLAEAAAADLMRVLFGNDVESKGIGGGGGLLSSAVSGLGDFFGDIFGGFNANGGYIGAGKIGVVGERGPELVYGGNTGKTIARLAPQGGYNTGGNVNVNIINNNGSQVQTQQRQTSNGMDLEVMIDQAVADKISTPGTRTNQALAAYSNRGMVRR